MPKEMKSLWLKDKTTLINESSRFALFLIFPLYLSSRSYHSPFTNSKYAKQNFNFNLYWLLLSQQIYIAHVKCLEKSTEEINTDGEMFSPFVNRHDSRSSLIQVS